MSKYCTHCGTKLIQNAKFCPSCGVSISKPKKKKEKDPDKASPFREITHKRVSNSLKDTVKSTFEDKTQEIIEENNSKPIASQKTSASKQNTPATDRNKKISKKISKWLLYYILVNIPIYFVNTGDDAILGVILLSVLVLFEYIIHLIKKKRKEKSGTVFLRIVLIAQGVFAVYGINQRLEYIESGSSLVAVISLVLLILLNINLILKRNI